MTTKYTKAEKVIAYKALVCDHNANQRPKNGDWSYPSLVGILCYRPDTIFLFTGSERAGKRAAAI